MVGLYTCDLCMNVRNILVAVLLTFEKLEI